MKKFAAFLMFVGLIGLALYLQTRYQELKKIDSEATSETTSVETTEETTDTSPKYGYEVNEQDNLVSVTFPCFNTQEQVDYKVANTSGYISGTVNKNGSVTYVMTKEAHQKLVGETKERIDDFINNVVGSKLYPNVKGITYSDDYTLFVIDYAAEKLSFNESSLGLKLMAMGRTQVIYFGHPSDAVTAIYVNSKTGEIIKEENYAEVRDAVKHYADKAKEAAGESSS